MAAESGSRTRTVLIVVAVVLGALVLGCLVCGVSGYFWAQRTASEVGAEAMQTVGEAEQFAASHDQQACVGEALWRADACGEASNIMCRAQANVFLRRCIDRAQPTEGFCDAVPPAEEIMRRAAWAAIYCQERGRAEDRTCPQLVSGVVEHCAMAATR